MITHENIKEWGAVSVAHTRRAAAIASSGVDFNSSSKGAIYKWFSKKPPTGTADPQKFFRLMNALADVHEDHRKLLGSNIEEVFHLFTR